jgi:hypothetical protein
MVGAVIEVPLLISTTGAVRLSCVPTGTDWLASIYAVLPALKDTVEPVPVLNTCVLLACKSTPDDRETDEFVPVLKVFEPLRVRLVAGVIVTPELAPTVKVLFPVRLTPLLPV